MSEPARTADVLGGRKVFERPIRSLADLRAAVESGLPKEALDQVLRYATDDPALAARVRARIVAPATWKRRTRLKPAESDRAARLARVVALAFEVWHDDAEAVAGFFTTPHAELDGARPLDVADSDAGAEQVTLILRRLQHGIPV